MICIAAMLFLRTFMTASALVNYITFQSVVRIGEDGSVSPCVLDEYCTMTSIEDDAVYRFSAEVEGIQENSYLLLETAGVNITVHMDGETVLQSIGTASYGMQTISVGQVHVPFPPGAESCLVEIDYQVLDPDNAMHSPLARVTSETLLESNSMAYANLYGMPTGCLMTVFVLVCGMFLLGITQGLPDFTLLALIAAAGLMGVCEIARGCGHYFLPAAINRILNWNGFFLLSPAALLVWLLLRRKQGTLRQLGLITAAAGLAVLCAYLISLARGGYLSGYVNDMFIELFLYGSYIRPVYWLTVYLIIVSAAISAHGLMHEFAKMKADARTLALKNELAGNSYRAAEEKLRQNALLRHEWKNYVSALQLLQQQGDLEGLGSYLKEMDGRLDKLAPQQYTGNFAVNTILQSTAARAETLSVSFNAAASVPPALSIDMGDLCSLLLNLLDNALEGASKVPDPGAREVECTLRIKQGYLAIKCENTYAGHLSHDEHGQLQTTKADGDGHGFGLTSIKAIAEKYGGAIDISYTDERFTVRTALKLPQT